MLRTATDTRAAKKALVRTYDQPSYRDPWRVVQDYRGYGERWPIIQTRP